MVVGRLQISTTSFGVQWSSFLPCRGRFRPLSPTWEHLFLCLNPVLPRFPLVTHFSVPDLRGYCPFPSSDPRGLSLVLFFESVRCPTSLHPFPHPPLSSRLRYDGEGNVCQLRRRPRLPVFSASSQKIVPLASRSFFVLSSGLIVRHLPPIPGPEFDASPPHCRSVNFFRLRQPRVN